MNNANQLYNKYFHTCKQNHDSENVKDWEKRGRNYKQFEIIDNGDQEPKLTTKEETKTKKSDEIQKLLWIKLNKNDFDSLTEDVYNNLNNSEFKTTAGKRTYYLKNAKKLLLEITTKKISENEALKLYADLIRPEIATLKK